MIRTASRASLLALSSIAFVACGGASAPGGGAHGADAAIGSPAPDFSQAIVANGAGRVSLRDLRGKVAIVDFWATWCEPCKKSFPKLEEIHVKYRGSGFEIVGISEDEEKSGIADFAKELGAKFPLAWDADKAIAGAWHPQSMPSTFVVDRQGVVRFAHFGYHDGEEVEIEHEVKSLL